ncbi:unnamed protein product [Chrysodeixis includens]|uniref:Uncharacterized protein n=1 Tax=Chrysodeixis includens TaxID=689277 RepID=A0A9N8KRD9_CHRIL|nr:unnamed protein product [Chrysodeixis includens]
MEDILRRLLVTEKYDSISNFLSFYDSYMKSQRPLRDVFDDYIPSTRPFRHTCVGLGLELLRRYRCLESRFPGVRKSMAILSCEESVKDVDAYCRFTSGPHELLAPDKEHVLVGVPIELDGRRGLLIADPGYHIGRIVTVMVDGEEPHTGWFNQSNEPEAIKDYCYAYSQLNTEYVVWQERVERETDTKLQKALIYTARQYCDAINVTEKRNLVYRLRSYVSRDYTGRVTAGIGFLIKTNTPDLLFSLFYQINKRRRKFKFRFSDFEDISSLDDSILNHVSLCNMQLQLPKGELLSLIHQLSKAVADHAFISQCLDINVHICQMCI